MIKNLTLYITFICIYSSSFSFEKRKYEADTLNNKITFKKNLNIFDLSIFETSFGYNYNRQIKKKNYLGVRFGLWYFPSRGDLPLSLSTNSIPFFFSLNYSRFVSSKIFITGSITQRLAYSWPIKENNSGLKDKVSYSDISSINIYGSYVIWNHFVPSIGGTINFDRISNNFYPRFYAGLAFKF